MIATSHGVIWRDNPTQIVQKYLEWADAYQENRISIVYDTMWEPDDKILNEAWEYGRDFAGRVVN